MKVVKEKNPFDGTGKLSDIKFEEDGKVWSILFGGNGDLYWKIDTLQEDTDYETFSITKENYTIYQIMDELYKRIQACHVYDPDALELELCETEEEREKVRTKTERLNADLKMYTEYDLLCNGTSIEWHSDEEPYNQADVFRITPEEDTYLIEFIRQTKEDNYWLKLPGSICIRIRNSGSTYHPFNFVFMQMYNALQSYCPEYHQVHLEEVMYEKKLEYKKANQNDN